MKPRLRRLVRTDVDAVVGLCNEAIMCGESTWGPEPVNASLLNARLCENAARFEAYVAETAEGHVIGWAGLLPHTDRPVYNVSAELEVFVAKSQRRRGVARALVSQLLARATALDFHSLLLIVQDQPTRPIAWAVRLGFQSVGYLACVYPARGEWRDLLVLEKFLTPELASPHATQR